MQTIKRLSMALAAALSLSFSPTVAISAPFKGALTGISKVESFDTAAWWRFWEGNPEEEANTQTCVDDCMARVEVDRDSWEWECYSHRYRAECRARCKRAALKEGIKNASIEGQNYSRLFERKPPRLWQTYSFPAKPFMLAMDYDGCVHVCICEGGSSSECHRVCEE